MTNSKASLLLAALMSLLWPPPLAAGDDSIRHLRVQEGRKLEILISSQFTPVMRDNLLQWVDSIAAALRDVWSCFAASLMR